MKQLKLSVITINFNNVDGLKKTIQSVVSQMYSNYEYIIIDGGSTDGSIDIIKQYTEKISYWISEPDKGIYNAMNKGIVQANGEYIHFLNSGDWLIDGEVYSKIFPNTISEDIIYGNRIQVYDNGKKYILNKNYQKSEFTFKEIFQGCIFHTCSFTKKELFDKFGYFNENFKIVSDYGFFLKAMGFGQATVKYLDITISYFDMSGISQNETHREKQNKEIEAIRKLILPRSIIADYNTFLEYDRMMKKMKSHKWSWFLFRAINKLSNFIYKK